MGFDRFAGRYEQILQEGVSLSGEGPTYFAEAKARYLVDRVSSSFEGKVLDFGCGVGLVSTALATLMPRAVLHGVDPSEQSIARIPEAVRARGRFVASIDDLDRDYGVVVVANVLHHIPPSERQASIAALAARLAPGGLVVVFEHNPWNPATRYIVATCDLDDDAILLHRRETTGLLRGAGLDVVRHDYVTFFPRALTWLRALEPRLAWIPAGAQYAVVARASS